MTILYLILRCELALCAIFGLWSHDWRLIFAAVFCFLVVPLIRDEIEV